MGMAAPTYYTADMVRAMPDDGNRRFPSALKNSFVQSSDLRPIREQTLAAARPKA